MKLFLILGLGFAFLETSHGRLNESKSDFTQGSRRPTTNLHQPMVKAQRSITAMATRKPIALPRSFLWIVGALVALKLLAEKTLLSRRAKSATGETKGKTGENRVRRALRKLVPDQYHCFHDIYVDRADGNGITQIDHVVVSPFGIFVIETKNLTGWIFGDESSSQWTQSLPGGKKFSFQNPLHQNQMHVRALKKALFCDSKTPGIFHNVVVFVGDSIFKTDVPVNVQVMDGLLNWIKAHREEVFTPRELERISNFFEDLDRNTDKRATGKMHIKQILARFPNSKSSL